MRVSAATFAPLVLGSVLLPAAIAAVPLDTAADLTSAARLASLPDGGFVAVWNRERIEPLSFGPAPCVAASLAGAFLTDGGEPTAPPREIPLPGGDAGVAPRVAATGAGELALAWLSAGGLRVGSLSDELRVTSSSLLATCHLRSHELVAAGDGFWAVWSETCPEPRVRARRLDRRTRPAGPVLEIGDPFLAPGPGVAAAGTDDGGLIVTWAETVGDVGRKVLWTRLDARGERLFPGSPVGFGEPEQALAAASLPDGGAAFAWSEDRGRILLTRFPGASGPLGPVRQAAVEPGEREATPRLAVAPGGLLVLTWSRPLAGDPPPGCPVRVFDLDLEPVTGVLPLAEGCLEPTSLAVSTTGAVLATWIEDAGLSSAFCHRALGAEPPVGVLAPPVPPVASPEVPRFRFRVRIGGDEPAPRVGSPFLPCLPETVCVSGALPGRPEVLLRVVGPKPNGFLWPTIVRFTTSQVEVWIDQPSSGVGRYYRLEGSVPGSDSLRGLFDRTGFRP